MPNYVQLVIDHYFSGTLLAVNRIALIWGFQIVKTIDKVPKIKLQYFHAKNSEKNFGTHFNLWRMYHIWCGWALYVSPTLHRNKELLSNLQWDLGKLSKKKQPNIWKFSYVAWPPPNKWKITIFFSVLKWFLDQSETF